ncbi:MAG: helical backbone metal receptor [Planctomycetota bacterium]
MSGRAHGRRRMARVLLAAAWLASCERPPTAPAPGTGSPSRPTTDTALRNWVLQPPVTSEERDSPCPRLLSTAPNLTEVCCALGLADRLVGRTRYCTYPPAVQSVRSIGALNDLNVEVLLEIKPELVLIAGQSRAITERLSRLNCPFESLPDVSLADLYTTITRLGELTGRPLTARRLAEGIQADLATVARRYQPASPARVLLVLGALRDPPVGPTAAGPGSFYDDLLRRTGHVNAAATDRPFAPLGLEFILAADPDVIIELVPEAVDRPGGDADARRVWGRVGPLRAVEQQRVHVVVGPEHYLLGPRLPQTMEALCKLIAGERHD